jgi:hypothetical protein
MAGGVVGVVGGAVVVLGRRREQHTLPATHTNLQIQSCKARRNGRLFDIIHIEFIDRHCRSSVVYLQIKWPCRLVMSRSSF